MFCHIIYNLSFDCIFMIYAQKTNDVPEYLKEEGEMVVPSYGYFIRGAQTTFSGVLRSV